MALELRDSNRWALVEYDPRPTVAKLRRQILEDQNVQSGFSILTAPAPAHDVTLFKVIGNERHILVGIAMQDSVKFLSPLADKGMIDEAEILFDPLNDRLGWFQFHFSPGKAPAADGPTNPHRDRESADEVHTCSHLPYAEAYSSDCFDLKLGKWETREEEFTTCKIARLRCRWVFARFRTKEVFRNGHVCGFNVCRHRRHLAEFSSWNYCSGNGSQDATGFGKLYLASPPAYVRCDRAELDGGRLRLEGERDGKGKLSMELVDSMGERHAVAVTSRGGRWRGEVDIDLSASGRCRLYPKCGRQPVEPEFIAIDLPSASRRSSFCMSVLYDTPMSIIANYYTPARLDRDMALWAEQGIGRVHWIEYGDWPSFWLGTNHGWKRHYQRTIRECGDLLPAAVKAAHGNGLELIGDLKTFDLGFNCFFVDNSGSSVADLEGRQVSVIPEIAAHQEWTMQADPRWLAPASAPIASLRLHSETPIPRIDAAKVHLLISGTNRRYRRSSGDLVVTQGETMRRHQRWTPAGNEPERGRRKNWYVEISGLDLRTPYAAVDLGIDGLQLHHRGFMLAEARDGAGKLVPLTLATNGDAADGYFYWKGWPGWSNQTEALLQVRHWDARNLGLACREMPNMPTLLEPTFAGARSIWLGRIQQILDRGADGVDIRTYCHHNGPMHYLKYAFAEPVRQAFERLYGREPGLCAADYERVRRIRGEAYTEFIRAAKQLTASRGKKLIVELESGIEVPASLNCRMQLALEWRKWIEEEMIDEIRLKWWTAQSPFVHAEILPLARRHGIPVHLTSRCLHTGIDVRARELGQLLFGGAQAAGFDGYCLYEQQNLMDLNPAGRSTFKGPVRTFLEAARQSLG